MKKLMLGLLMLAGAVASSPAAAQFVVVPIVPVRPCVYRLVPVTQYQLVLTVYGWVYQPVTTYVYQLVCY